MTKKERVLSVFAGKQPDKIPAGFWFHFNGSYSVDEMAEAHLQFYRKTDMDIVKVMQDYIYQIDQSIQTPSDWYRLKMPGRESAVYQKLETVLKKIVAEVNGEALVFQTMFGPFKAASFMFGDALLMAHSKEDPKAVAAGIQNIAESLQEWASGYLDAGADGIYLTAQFGEVGRFTKEEWEMLVRPSDLMVLNVAASRSEKYNILHICGEPEYDFKVHLDRFPNYPGDIVNWSVKDTGMSLAEGRKLFHRPILGGMNNKGAILTGSIEEIREEAQACIRSAGDTKGFMLGADCTIQGKNISIEKIAAAVAAAHDFKL